MNPGMSLSTVSVMMLGSIEYISTWVAPFVHNPNPSSLQGSTISFFMLAAFILLMPILLMNLLVSLSAAMCSEEKQSHGIGFTSSSPLLQLSLFQHLPPRKPNSARLKELSLLLSSPLSQTQEPLRTQPLCIASRPRR